MVFRKERTMSYCSTLTDKQVQNVLKIETDRLKRYEGTGLEMGDSETLIQDARETLLRRGIDPDLL